MKIGLSGPSVGGYIILNAQCQEYDAELLEKILMGFNVKLDKLTSMFLVKNGK
jgi:hypothetical protein